MFGFGDILLLILLSDTALFLLVMNLILLGSLSVEGYCS